MDAEESLVSKSGEESYVSESQINEHFKQYHYENDIFNIDCNVHQNKGMNEYVYSLDVNLSETIPPEFIIIIDRSGSMGSDFNYIITKTIPEVLDGLNGHGVCATALVEGGIEILPLFLHHLVVLKLVTAFGPFVA